MWTSNGNESRCGKLQGIPDFKHPYANFEPSNRQRSGNRRYSVSPEPSHSPWRWPQSDRLHKVAFVPGEPFSTDGNIRNTMRLNFSNASDENIVEGIKRLGEVINQELENRK